MNYFRIASESESIVKGSSARTICNIVNGRDIFIMSVPKEEAGVELQSLNGILEDQLKDAGLTEPNATATPEFIKKCQEEDVPLVCPVCYNEEIDDEWADGITFTCEICGNSFEIEYQIKNITLTEENTK